MGGTDNFVVCVPQAQEVQDSTFYTQVSLLLQQPSSIDEHDSYNERLSNVFPILLVASRPRQQS